jgi:hypothetical protein
MTHFDGGAKERLAAGAKIATAPLIVFVAWNRRGGHNVSLNAYESPTEPSLLAHPRGNNLLRGVGHGIGLAVVSILPLIIIAFVKDALEPTWLGGPQSNPEALISYLRNDGLLLTLTLPLVAFSTGVAAASPNKMYSYATTLALIVVLSVPVAFLLSQFNIPPPRIRSSPQPQLYLSEVVMFWTPIVVATAIITFLRWEPTEVTENTSDSKRE